MFGRRREKGVYSIEEIAERVRPVAERYELEYVLVFGSYGRGTADRKSDVDLLVSEPNVKGIGIGGLYLDLMDALDKRIDLVTDEANPRFLDIIKKDAMKVYG